MLIIGALVAGCGVTPSTGEVLQPVPTVERTDLQIVTGQRVFVPAYSEIFYGGVNTLLDLTTTLAIHNADPENPILITSIEYYNTDGELVRDYVDAPLRLNPLATTGIVVEQSDDSGGWGANFLVEWGAETPVYEPVIEAVMVSRQGTEGVSFISAGRVISETTP